MKTKTITLKIKIPAEYKYLAKEQYGQIILFKRKPKRVSTKIANYWATHNDEIVLVDNLDINICNEGVMTLDKI